jgi:hypothetical protein
VNGIGYRTKMPKDGEEQEGDDRKITIFVLYRLKKKEKCGYLFNWSHTEKS